MSASDGDIAVVNVITIDLPVKPSIRKHTAVSAPLNIDLNSKDPATISLRIENRGYTFDRKFFTISSIYYRNNSY